MLPWPPKMATGKDFVKKAVDKFIGAKGALWQRQCGLAKQDREWLWANLN